MRVDGTIEKTRLRVPLVDGARGAAIVAMIAYHLIWDLGHFALIPEDIPWRTDFLRFGHGIAATFLMVAGVSLALATRRGIDARAFWRRLALLAAAAGGVSLATYVAFPDAFVFFGILHCIALATLGARPLLFAPVWVVGALAALVLLLPLVATGTGFDHPWLLWTGLGTTEPVTNDWRPFFPWAGLLFAGLALGRAAIARRLDERLARVPLDSVAGRWLRFGGRHSLAIYLLHQPLLYGALFGLVAAFGPYPPTEEGAFLRACETQCLAHSDHAYCTRVCGCVAERTKVTTLWRGVLANRLDPGETKRFDDIARTCVRDSSPR